MILHAATFTAMLLRTAGSCQLLTRTQFLTSQTLGAFHITEDTRKYSANLFESLLCTWAAVPGVFDKKIFPHGTPILAQDLDDIRKIIRRIFRARNKFSGSKRQNKTASAEICGGFFFSACKIYLIMNNLLDIFQRLCDEVETLRFSSPVVSVYNPLRYAWDGFRQYAEFSHGRKRVVFLGINPGPWGMAQTGIPFGEINAVKNFMGINDITISPPDSQNVSYPVRGLECGRSEVSGKRLWGLFASRFGSAERFFSEHFVLNYCPLLFIGRTDKGSIRNLTPDKLDPSERERLCRICDSALIEAVESLKPDYVVGVGTFAYQRAKFSLIGQRVEITKILHPSPANPRANHDWAGKTERTLIEAGIWQ